jgi:hypothetical protein
MADAANWDAVVEAMREVVHGERHGAGHIARYELRNGRQDRYGAGDRYRPGRGL